MSLLNRDVLTERELWQDYWQHSSSSARNALIECYQPLLAPIVKYLFKLYGNTTMEFDDFYQNAVLGLYSAIDGYAENTGASFKTYATYRIKGSVLNGLPSMSEHLSFSAYKKARLKARLESVAQGKHSTSRHEDIGHLVVGLAVAEILEAAFMEGATFGLDGEMLHVAETSSLRIAKNWADPYRNYSLAKLLLKAKTYIAKLSEAEQAVVKMHYYDDLTFVEIGQMLGLSKGRISQIHKKAIEGIRELIAA